MNKKNIYDFSGGYNDTVHNLNLKDNEFSEFYNVDPMPNGGFRVRNGTKQLNNVAFPGEITQLIEWKLRNGATKTIVISNRKMYEFSSVLGEWSVIKFENAELELASDTVAYTFFRDFFYFSDGERMFQWDDNIYYLSNLDEYEHRFKAGDIIKLTVSKQESLFRGEEGVMMDVRNQMRSKITYAQYCYQDETYKNKNVYKIKYKFFDQLSESKELYALKYSEFIGNSDAGWYVMQDGTFKDLRLETKPFHGTVLYQEGEELEDNSQHYIGMSDVATQRHIEIYGIVNFEHIGNEGDYYKFNNDVTDFYPHNFNYITKEKYYYTGTNSMETAVVKIEESELSPKITEFLDIPPEILACQYFCFYGKRQRFFASGNPNDPTAVYVSKLGTFEEWEDAVTIYPDCNLGAVTGLRNMDDDIIICFENGFSYVDSDLSIADGSEAVVEYIPRISSVPIGVSSGETLCTVPEGIVFYHNENIYLATYSLFGKNYVKMPSQNEFICLSRNKCENVLKGSTKHKAVYHNHKYYLSFLDAETRDRILIYDFSEGHFLLYGDVPVSGFISKAKGNELLISSGKYLLSAFREGVYSDAIAGSTAPISFAVKSKFFDCGYDYRRLQLRRLYLVMNAYEPDTETENGNESQVQILLRGDAHNQDIQDTLKDGILWKTSTWGEKYAWNNDFVIHAFNLNFTTNRIGFSVMNTEETNLKAPLVFFCVTLDYDKLGEDQTKLQDELMVQEIPDFQHWPDERE